MFSRRRPHVVSGIGWTAYVPKGGWKLRVFDPQSQKVVSLKLCTTYTSLPGEKQFCYVGPTGDPWLMHSVWSCWIPLLSLSTKRTMYSISKLFPTTMMLSFCMASQVCLNCHGVLPCVLSTHTLIFDLFCLLSLPWSAGRMRRSFGERLFHRHYRHYRRRNELDSWRDENPNE